MTRRYFLFHAASAPADRGRPPARITRIRVAPVKNSFRPESVERYTRLEDRLAEAGMATRIADGENFREPEQFDPYLKPRRLMEVLQLDIHTGGLLANLQVAKAGQLAGAMTIPHNWDSRLGFLTGLHTTKAVSSVPWADDDRSTYDVGRGEATNSAADNTRCRARPAWAPGLTNALTN